MPLTQTLEIQLDHHTNQYGSNQLSYQDEILKQCQKFVIYLVYIQLYFTVNILSKQLHKGTFYFTGSSLCSHSTKATMRTCRCFMNDWLCTLTQTEVHFCQQETRKCSEKHHGLSAFRKWGSHEKVDKYLKGHVKYTMPLCMSAHTHVHLFHCSHRSH